MAARDPMSLMMACSELSVVNWAKTCGNWASEAGQEGGGTWVGDKHLCRVSTARHLAQLRGTGQSEKGLLDPPMSSSGPGG